MRGECIERGPKMADPGAASGQAWLGPLSATAFDASAGAAQTETQLDENTLKTIRLLKS